MALQLGAEAGADADAVVLRADAVQLCDHGRFLSTSLLTPVLQGVVSAVDGLFGVAFCAAAAAAGVLARMIPPHFGRCPSFAVDEAFRVPLWRWSRLNVTAIIARINVLLLVCFPGRLVCVLPKEVGHL